MRHSSRKDEQREPSRLQRELTDRILRLLRDDGIGPGDHLNENGLAQRLGVSRTPVRAAFDRLAGLGVVARRPNRGVEVIGVLPEPGGSDEPPAIDDDDLMIRLSRDRETGTLPDEPSESELMKAYGLNRATVQRVLGRLADLGLVARKPGHGWRFQPTTADEAIRSESYRFRLILEPQALLEPSFRIDPGWLAEMRARHLETIARPWHETASVAFFDMNARFHEGLAQASGNRFVLSAVQQQNQLRRFANYNWRYGFERVEASCREHLEILDRIAEGELEIASLLLRRHLQRSRALHPEPAEE